MKEYHSLLYAVYATFLLRIVLTILMRYMFLLKLVEFTTCSSYQKSNLPPRKTTFGQNALSYVALKSTSVNAFEHNIKQHYFNKLKKKEL